MIAPNAFTLAGPLLTIDRSATGVSVSISDAVLFPGTVSITVPGTMTVAVLVIVPVAVGAMAAVTVNVAVPLTMSVTSSLIGPLPLGLPHADPADATHVQLVKLMPAGGVSTTPAPATTFGPLLVATMVYVVVVPGTALPTPSVFVTARSALPVAASVACAGSGLVTPCADVKAPAPSVLMRLPLALATTLTWIRHDAFAAMLPLVRVTVPAPATAVSTPPQVLVAAGGVAMTMPTGSVSVRAVAVRASAFALVFRTLIVSCDTPPTRTVAGLNDLFSVTLVTTRVITAFAAAGLMKPSIEVTAPAAIVLVGAPAPAGVVMLTRIVHDVAAAPPASDPPASETLPPAAVTTPPQLFTRLGVADTT